jgi:hypothetical protein
LWALPIATGTNVVPAKAGTQDERWAYQDIVNAGNPTARRRGDSAFIRSEEHLESRYEDVGMTSTKADGALGVLELVMLFGGSGMIVVPAKAGTQDEDVPCSSPRNEGNRMAT